MGEPLTLAEYMLEAEKADDLYQELIVAAAVARADYEDTRNQAKARSKATSVAARDEEADQLASHEKRLYLIAEAREKAARTHVSVLLGLMVASQSWMKNAGKQDGGEW